jgi:hypothetical protein
MVMLRMFSPVLSITEETTDMPLHVSTQPKLIWKLTSNHSLLQQQFSQHKNRVKASKISETLTRFYDTVDILFPTS